MYYYLQRIKWSCIFNWLWYSGIYSQGTTVRFSFFSAAASGIRPQWLMGGGGGLLAVVLPASGCSNWGSTPSSLLLLSLGYWGEFTSPYTVGSASCSLRSVSSHLCLLFLLKTSSHTGFLSDWCWFQSVSNMYTLVRIDNLIRLSWLHVVPFAPTAFLANTGYCYFNPEVWDVLPVLVGPFSPCEGICCPHLNQVKAV